MLILLDRDGVINTEVPPNGTTNIEALSVYDFAPKAISRLKHVGYDIVVVTNQSAVEKGLMSIAILHEIHEKIQTCCHIEGGAIDAFYFCTDHPMSPTHRRKPEAGMIYEALHDFGANASETIFVGDSARDVLAAQTAGCIPYLVKTGNGGETHANWQGRTPYLQFDTLADVARYLTK